MGLQGRSGNVAGRPGGGLQGPAAHLDAGSRTCRGRGGGGGRRAGEAGWGGPNRAARGPAGTHKRSPVGIGSSDHPRQLLCRLGRCGPLLRHSEPRAGPGGPPKAWVSCEERLEGLASGSRPSFRAHATCAPALATAAFLRVLKTMVGCC